jgi:DNA mismatch endonuclease (patch repair protein)
MPDTVSPEARSRVMARVKGRNTGPEIALRKALFAAGVRGWRCNRADLPGKPDLSFGPARVAVFVDGAFWHGHPSKYWQGRSGPYWDNKIRRNQERDKRVTTELRDAGWKVVRLWDFEVERNLDDAVQKVKEAL